MVAVVAVGAYAIGPAGPPAPRPALAPAADDRPACQAVQRLNDFADPPTIRGAGIQAATAADPGIAAAGQRLVDAADWMMHDPGMSANVVVAAARMRVVAACAARFEGGPGPA